MTVSSTPDSTRCVAKECRRQWMPPGWAARQRLSALRKIRCPVASTIGLVGSAVAGKARSRAGTLSVSL